ncbi:hypothetical protein BDZ97DRAFT_2076761 [Flammula alnicola]|nr:hypothetical protein BDZ97DRAFT_2076761 [Flammula alnicola]
MGLDPRVTFPVELLHEIIALAALPPNQAELRDLCLVSRQFKDIVQPLLFSNINVGGFSSSVRTRLAQLRDLSDGNFAASSLARTITIDFTASFTASFMNDPAKVIDLMERTMLKRLPAAIRSFKNVNRVICIIGPDDPDWIYDLIVNGMKSYPLTDLAICFPLQITTSFMAVCNLQRLCVECVDGNRYGRGYWFRVSMPELTAKLISQSPNLSHLEVSLPRTTISTLFKVLDADHSKAPLSITFLSVDGLTVSPEDLLPVMRHFRKLKYLAVRNTVYYVLNRHIWEIFLNQRIHLTGIVTDLNGRHSLGSYLKSFQGLEVLALHHIEIRPLSADLLDTLLQTVVEQHSNSLLELQIFLGWGDRSWILPLREGLVSLLSSFTNLRRFGVAIGSRFGDACELQRLLEPLFSMCTDSFPELEELTLRTSGSPFDQRDLPRCFRVRHSKPQAVTRNNVHSGVLHDAISIYRSNNLTIDSFWIKAPETIYIPRRDSTTGAVRYVPST